MKTPFRIAALACLALLTSCADLKSHGAAESILQISGLNTGSPETFPAVLRLPDGKPAVLYASPDSRVTLQINGRTTLLDEKAPVHSGNRFQLHQQGKSLYASWWSHENNKNLYITRSTDEGKSWGAVSIINDQHGVLPPYSLSFGANGVVGATYSDERSPKYEVYFNRSTDYGLNWPRPDTRLDEQPTSAVSFAVEPRTVQIGKTWITFWNDVSPIFAGTNVYQVHMRLSPDEGKTWGKVQDLYSSQHQISSMQVIAAGDKIAVVFDDYRHGIKALVSPDEGQTWMPVATSEGSTQMTNSGLVLASSDGYVYASWISQNDGKKPDILFDRLSLADGKWVGATQRIDVKQYSNTTSMLPTIYAFEHGPVVMAWVDYRDIKPNIFMSLSADHGKTWSAPQPFGKPGMVNLGLPKLLPWADGLALAYESFPKDQPTNGEFILANLNIDAKTKSLPVYAETENYTPEQKKKQLVERVNKLAQLRIEKKYPEQYGFFDYAMRAFMPEKDFIEKSGIINYYKIELVKDSVEGNIAEIEQKMTYDSKPFPLPNGKMASVKKVTVDVKSTWVWVGDNWYLVYAPSFGKPLLSY